MKIELKHLKRNEWIDKNLNITENVYINSNIHLINKILIEK